MAGCRLGCNATRRRHPAQLVLAPGVPFRLASCNLWQKILQDRWMVSFFDPKVGHVRSSFLCRLTACPPADVLGMREPASLRHWANPGAALCFALPGWRQDLPCTLTTRLLAHYYTEYLASCCAVGRVGRAMRGLDRVVSHMQVSTTREPLFVSKAASQSGTFGRHRLRHDPFSYIRDLYRILRHIQPQIHPFFSYIYLSS